MEKILDIKAAKKLLGDSSKRRDEIIRQMNKSIEDGANNGLSHAHIPFGLNEFELSWLADELTIQGYTVNLNERLIRF